MVDDNNIWCEHPAGSLSMTERSLAVMMSTGRQAKISVVRTYIDTEGNLWFGTSQGLKQT